MCDDGELHMRKILLAVALILSAAATKAVPETAPPFTLEDASGHEVTVPSHQSGVDIILFWASWCPYCKAFMPHLQSIRAEYGDAVRVYALQIRDDADPAEFMADHGYDFVLLPDADPVMARYGVKATPGLFLIDARGRIRFNLYELALVHDPQDNSRSHRQKAARRAPHWAAAVRREIDAILAGSAP
jgi:thiol-disulfide isomerase/thioredoxin